MKLYSKSILMFICLVILLVCPGGYAQNGWTNIYSGDQHLFFTTFTSPSVGWAVTIYPPTTVWGTQDGGLTWNPIVPWTQAGGGHLVMHDANTAIMCASSVVLLTDDAFASWRTVHLADFDSTVEDAVYLDASHLLGIGYGIGYDSLFNEYAINRIWASNDAGFTWHLQYRDSVAGTLDSFGDICMSESGTVLVLYQPSSILRSDDAGQTWQDMGELPRPNVSTIESSAPNVFFACATDYVNWTPGHPSIMRSLDDGWTWDVVWVDSSLMDMELSDIEFADSLHGWAVGHDGIVVQTHDGGTTWEYYQLEGVDFGLTDASFLDSTLGWAVDPGGGGATHVFRFGNPNRINDHPPSVVPEVISLTSAYPNPFNSTTQLRFELFKPSHVELSVINTLGQRVSALADEDYTAGSHTVVWDAREFASGVYFAQLRTGSQSRMVKMVLMK